MKRNYITALLAASLGLSTGCASFEKPSFWSNPFARTKPPVLEDEQQPSPSALATLKSKFSRGDKEELSPEFQAAQKTLKKHPEKTLLAWARYQEDIGEFAEARKMYRELQIAYPKSKEAWLGMARIELATGRTQQAHEILTKLVQDDPANVEVRLALGRMYAEQEKWDDALAAFEEACELSPDDQNCRYELGVAFAESGNYDQALTNLTYAVGEPAAHYNIGYLLYEKGRSEDAAEWFRNALAHHPDNQTALKSRAMLAKLEPQEPGLPSTQMVAQQGSSYSNPNVRARRPFGTPSATVEPQMQAAAEPDGVELPVVSAGRTARNPSVLNDGTQGAGSTYMAAETPSSSPFRPVSYSTATPTAADTAHMPAEGGSRQPAQWSGPSSRPTQSANSSPPAAKDPANWRAHQN
jgi:tetratricopeptide (TPR) repeat protein